MNKIFEPRPPLKVKDLSEINIEELLKETFTMTIIQTEARNKDGTQNAVRKINVYFSLFLTLYFLVLFDSKGSVISKSPSRITDYCSVNVSTI